MNAGAFMRLGAAILSLTAAYRLLLPRGALTLGVALLFRWIRWLAIAGGPAARAAFVSYVTWTLGLRAPAGLVMLAYAILLARHFRRATEHPA